MTGKATPGPLAKGLTVASRRRALPLLRVVRPSRYTDADPFRVLMLPTEGITHLQERWSGPLDLPWMDTGRRGRHSALRRRWHAGVVLGGDWDLAVQAIDDYHLTRVLRRRFLEGLAWDEIPYVAKALRKVRDGEPAWGGRCRTEAQVRDRCRYLDELHADLARNGYRTPTGRAGVGFTHFLVNIGRDGRIIRNNDGKHRIILSAIIGIPVLAARVLVRHRDWQRQRDAVRAGAVPHDPAHPDLADLLDQAPLPATGA